MVPTFADLLRPFGLAPPARTCDATLPVRSPVTGQCYGELPATSVTSEPHVFEKAELAHRQWRTVPAPQRGQLVRELGNLLRQFQEPLGALVTFETGKIVSEGIGEVREMIDMADFCGGLCRQLYGLSISSERPQHRLYEVWHPLGPVGVITAFNFPVAVWAWNAFLAFIAGDSVVWKPSEKTPLTAWVVQHLFLQAAAKAGAPAELNQVLYGTAAMGARMVVAPQMKLISATGSTRMGIAVAQAAAQHLKRTLLELGGNNAAVIAPSADLKQALAAVAFAAVGTAGQRCTTLRRLFVHKSLVQDVTTRLTRIYERLPVGNPFASGTLVGPLVDEQAYRGLGTTLARLPQQAAVLSGGERVLVEEWPDAYYVRPLVVAQSEQVGPVLEETFAPLLYVMPYSDLDEAIALNNAAAHGLASCIFTRDTQEAAHFLAADGSDCGIANVNIGTSGAEIGGAFGGEKMTGGGRESGSDAWKAYMRRQTQTLNDGSALPLAQGVRFEITE